ncbi:hypothetical protein QBC38DRAFT_440947 [Podospora fimiseda]|uniref:Ubiquitin-like domain-containing protein n=1 Tax=Podospora fimiseda TaxID=252190 RepID=A0AAN7H6W2_9PEZI|nr:hypothetical protein QBC38DRAFT_440947 [Podospora fimiseda]
MSVTVFEIQSQGDGRMKVEARTNINLADVVTVDGYLNISFRRTIKVPEVKDVTFKLPPDMGQFPLFPVSEHKENLPESFAEKGGILMPMYQTEAMWIDFDHRELGLNRPNYLMKIWVGGVNAVSGRPYVPTDGPSAVEADQDYMFVPGQPWLDGVAIEPGVVRQFVASRLGWGQTVEAQVTGAEKEGGIMIEVVALRPEKRDPPPPHVPKYRPLDEVEGEQFTMFVKYYTGQTQCYHVKPLTTIEELKNMVAERNDLLKTWYDKDFEVKSMVDEIRLTRCGILENHRTLDDYSISDSTTVHLFFPLRGGGGGPGFGPGYYMGIGAGGRIEQTIIQDKQHSRWPRHVSSEDYARFNVQILNSRTFTEVFGLAPPSKPRELKQYEQEGGIFFHFPEASSIIKGNFSMLKDIEGVDEMPEAENVHDQDVKDW